MQFPAVGPRAGDLPPCLGFLRVSPWLCRSGYVFRHLLVCWLWPSVQWDESHLWSPPAAGGLGPGRFLRLCQPASGLGQMLEEMPRMLAAGHLSRRSVLGLCPTTSCRLWLGEGGSPVAWVTTPAAGTWVCTEGLSGPAEGTLHTWRCWSCAAPGLAHVHTLVHVHTLTHMHTYTPTHTHPLSVHTHTCTNSQYTHAHMCTHTLTKCTYTQTCMCHARPHTCPCSHTQRHPPAHTWAHSWGRSQGIFMLISSTEFCPEGHGAQGPLAP